MIEEMVKFRKLLNDNLVPWHDASTSRFGCTSIDRTHFAVVETTDFTGVSRTVAVRIRSVQRDTVYLRSEVRVVSVCRVTDVYAVVLTFLEG